MPSVLAWENDHVFAGGWICIGRAGSFVKAGDRRAYQVGREGILVVRGTTASCAASTTPVGTVGMSCFRLAQRQAEV